MDTILHFDSVYRMQNLKQLLPNAAEFDFSHMEGVRGYCDQHSAACLREQLASVSAEGIHFLGSGNYHCMSLFFLEKISIPFSLVVLDHHTDMQPSMFGDLLSCGSWILNALETLSCLKEVLIIGVGTESLHGTKQTTLNHGDFFDIQETELLLQCHYHGNRRDGRERTSSVIILKENPAHDVDNCIKESLQNYIHYPVFLSIDKDVLSKAELETDWDQGSMTGKELSNTCTNLFLHSQLLGIDICGEPDTDFGLSRSMHINQELIRLFSSTTITAR